MAERIYLRGRTWWAWGYDADGRRWQASTRQRDKRAALAVARDLVRSRALDGAAPEALGLEAALLAHVEHRERLGRSAGTVRNLRQHGGHLCRVLGADLDLHAVTVDDLERYWDARVGEDAAPYTVAKELESLRAALRLAYERGRWHGRLAAVWPAELVRDVYTPRDRWLTQAEYVALRAALPATRREHLDAYVYTGARLRELTAVHAEHVDLDGGRLRLPGTKTRRSDRWVPIHDVIRPALERRSRRAGPLYAPWRQHVTLSRAAVSAGIEHVTFNDLRRTFASWLAQAGVPSLTTARLMGHGSTAMVERIYAQLAPQTLRDAVARLPTCSSIVANEAHEGAPSGSGGRADAAKTAGNTGRGAKSGDVR